MLIITSKLLCDNIVSVQVEGKAATQAEIICAYRALADAVDGMKEEKKGGENNGQ